MPTDNDPTQLWAPMGGTELMMKRLQESLDPALLSNFQILPSRVGALDETKLRIYWLHDLAEDVSVAHLAAGGWRKFHKLVFVSHWQMRAYIQRYEIPWSHCAVIPNAIEPIGPHVKPKGPIRLIYDSTPNRGLAILVPTFMALCETHDSLELDVYSSFKLYDSAERDRACQELFDMCRSHPKIRYHGTVPNAEIREALKQAHLFAYPSIWPETSCLCLIEAMSAGLLCVHPNLAALPETAANWTHQYQWQEDPKAHFRAFYQALDEAIRDFWTPGVQARLQAQVDYVDQFYDWADRKHSWTQLLQSLLTEDRSLPEPPPPGKLKQLFDGVLRSLRGG